MIGLRLTLAVFLTALCLLGTGGLGVARAQDPTDGPLRAEIEVNTTVLDELEGYTPPPMFGAPGRPVLSRPIERLALPNQKSSSANGSNSNGLKSHAERAGMRLAHPIIEAPRAPSATTAQAQTPTKRPPTPPARLASSDEGKVAPPPPSKPRIKTAVVAPVKPPATKVAKASAAPDLPPPVTKPTVSIPESESKSDSLPKSKSETPKVVAAKSSVPAPQPAAVSAAPKDEDLETLMPAMPAQDVLKEDLAGLPHPPPVVSAKSPSSPVTPAQSSPVPPVPVSNEALLAAPETTLSSAAQTLASLEPAAGQMAPPKQADPNKTDITAYDASDKALVPVSADISAGPTLRHPPAPKETQTKLETSAKAPAAIPESRRPDLLEEATLSFRKGQSDLDSAQTTPLKTKISTALIKNSRARIQILSYASAADDGQSSARRVSLLRALAVRSWLVSRGISPARIDVRALGEAKGPGGADRIDLVVYDPMRKS